MLTFRKGTKIEHVYLLDFPWHFATFRHTHFFQCPKLSMVFFLKKLL